jgi:hypothetical protein
LRLSGCTSLDSHLSATEGVDSHSSRETGIGSLGQNDGGALPTLGGAQESAGITGQRGRVEQDDQGHSTAGGELNGGPSGLRAPAADQHQVSKIYTG